MKDSLYEHHNIESKWYKFWENNALFTAQVSPASGKKFNIAIPPPNVTGTLHMGHGFECTIIDTLVRYHRMKGDATLWTVGTDHAGIATQMVVERQLQARNITKHDLGREAFVEEIWQWKKQSGDTITSQLRRLGSSVDWKNEYFTMQPEFQTAVTEAFVRLFEAGHIYKAAKMINWDTTLLTAVSDLEVESVARKGKMWYLQYPLEQAIVHNKKKITHITVATTRPETMLGDTAVAINPADELAQALVGKNVTLPIVNRQIPIIADEMVDMQTGSGFVKITPGHDFNDYAVGLRHQLPCHTIFTETGKVISGILADTLAIPEHLQSLDRYQARQQIIALFTELGLVEKIEDKEIMLPIADRSKTVCEPRITSQWFVKATTIATDDTLQTNAIDAVLTQQIQFLPDNWKNTYFAWMNNLHDWCISRQLWWGHRIPAWYDEDGNCYVGRTEQEVRDKLKQQDTDRNIKLTQDADVLDTWFSSSLWTFGTLGWPEASAKLKQWHPTSLLVTGFDIIFFWVARMIMMTTQLLDQIPFEKVMIHGLILDGQGQKMSKSKGNILDPIDLIQGITLPDLIEKRTYATLLNDQAEKITKLTQKEFPQGISAHGVDALRMTFCSLSGTSRDVHFDMQRLSGYRNFCNKIWNAAKFCYKHAENISHEDLQFTAPQTPLDHWILWHTEQLSHSVATHLESHRLDLASDALYHFIWDVFCDWYLEFAKCELDTDNNAGTIRLLLHCLDKLLLCAHPFLPFITEEIYQASPLRNNLSGSQPTNIDPLSSIMVQPWPSDNSTVNAEQSLINSHIECLQQSIVEIRKIRSENDISPSAIITILIQANPTSIHGDFLLSHTHIIERIAKCKIIKSEQIAPQQPCTLITIEQITYKLYLNDHINWTKEYSRILNNITKNKTETEQIDKQLNNQKFVEHAPSTVVNSKRERYNVLNQQIEHLEQQLRNAKNNIS